VLGPALPASVLTRIPRTDKARIKMRMGCSSLILKSLYDRFGNLVPGGF
jgi:hypothetical protein